MLLRNRLSRIFFKRRFFQYPIGLSLQTIMALGVFEVFLIALSYCRAAMLPIRPEKNLEDFFINRFGRRLYATSSNHIPRRFGACPAIASVPNRGPSASRGCPSAGRWHIWRKARYRSGKETFPKRTPRRRSSTVPVSEVRSGTNVGPNRTTCKGRRRPGSHGLASGQHRAPGPSERHRGCSYPREDRRETPLSGGLLFLHDAGQRFHRSARPGGAAARSRSGSRPAIPRFHYRRDSVQSAADR